MPSAMRYCLLGFLAASIAGLFTPPWYVVVVAYSAGMILGFVLGLSCSAWGMVLDRITVWWGRRNGDKPMSQ